MDEWITQLHAAQQLNCSGFSKTGSSKGIGSGPEGTLLQAGDWNQTQYIMWPEVIKFKHTGRTKRRNEPSIPSFEDNQKSIHSGPRTDDSLH